MFRRVRLNARNPSLARARPYTMVAERTLLELGHTVDGIVAERLEGAFVECGAWRGGCSFLMADMLRRRNDDRPVWMFDSFEGMPPAEKVDGEAARAWESAPDPYTNHCTASLDDVEATRDRLGLSNVIPVKGWFEDSLPAYRDEIGRIALLRIDCDWYASVMVCLETLYDQVVDGGFVLIDDYYLWDGCTIAIHEFLAARKLAHRLFTSGHTAYFRKK